MRVTVNEDFKGMFDSDKRYIKVFGERITGKSFSAQVLAIGKALYGEKIMFIQAESVMAKNDS